MSRLGDFYYDVSQKRAAKIPPEVLKYSMLPKMGYPLSEQRQMSLIEWHELMLVLVRESDYAERD